MKGLILCSYLFFNLKDTPQEVKEVRLSILYVVREIFKKKTTWMLCLAFGAMCFVNIGYVTWMSTFYHEKFQLSLSTAGFTSMFYHFGAAFIGVLIGGRLSDKYSMVRKTIRMETEFIGLLLGAPFIFLMGYTSNLYVSYTMLALFGFFRGIYDSNLYAALFDVISPDLRSSSVGIMTAFAFIVGAFAPVVLALLKSTYGLSFGISFLSVFYLIGAIAVFVAIKFFFLKEFYYEKK